ncbi:MAG: SMP-30/gluconolactonase/LRE family protein, partial [Anaerolineaceae bacterium]
MNMPEFKIVFSNPCGLGEGPVWDAENKKLYWVDIDYRKIFHGDPVMGTYQDYSFDIPVTALGIRQKGGLILATARGFALWDHKSSSLQSLGDPEAGKPNARFNDGAVDRSGRFWAGTMTETDAT